jgi:hypothetical protein
MPTLFIDDDFTCLQSCFCLLRLLLQYHDPCINSLLLDAGVTPELYATPWFFTYFANKCDRVDVICELWKRVIQEQDNKYIFFFSVALILFHRDQILQNDMSNLPGCMSGLQIGSIQQLDLIMEIAHELKMKTPISFWHSQEMEVWFGENSKENYTHFFKSQRE